MKERRNLIDGLPNSYDTHYVIKTKKCCVLCKRLITEKQIENNSIICSESFDFFHKACLKNKEISYSHYNSKDKSTPIVLAQPVAE